MMIFDSHKFSFKIPYENSAVDIEALIGRAWPEGTTAQIESLFLEERVRVNEIVVRKGSQIFDADANVSVDGVAGEEIFGLPDADDLARGDGWIVVDKPIGMPGKSNPDDVMDPVLFLADLLGVERDIFQPSWVMPTMAGGPWLCSIDEDARQRLTEAYISHKLMMTWVAIVPKVSMPTGFWEGNDGDRVDYNLISTKGELSEVQLTPKPAGPQSLLAKNPVGEIMRIASNASHPILGDRYYHGYMIDGGLRLRLAVLYQEGTDIGYSWSTPPGWWPLEPVILPNDVANKGHDESSHRVQLDDGKLVPTSLRVSAKTLEMLERHNHPWVYKDSQTGDYAHLRPGSAVVLVSPDGKRGPACLIENTGKLVARMWSESPDDFEDFVEEVHCRVDEAIARRAELLKHEDMTNIFRLIHGEADGLPGFLLDKNGPLLRATIVGRTSEAFKHIVYDNLKAYDPQLLIIEARHIQDVREEGKLPQAIMVQAGISSIKPGDRVIVKENGLNYWSEPWEGIDVGFFADQRDNRQKLRQLARPGSKWLNLFCHTGAFSVALIHEGADVVSVDLSRRYLEWLEDNLELNGLPLSKNTSVAADCRDFLKRQSDQYDGIIVDPPTAAAGTRAFWSVRKDYEDLLQQCFRQLKSDGIMLVCRNDRKRTPSLETLVRSAAQRAKWAIATIEQAGPNKDFPRLKGFLEGDSFEGLIVYGSK